MPGRERHISQIKPGVAQRQKAVQADINLQLFSVDKGLAGVLSVPDNGVIRSVMRTGYDVKRRAFFPAPKGRENLSFYLGYSGLGCFTRAFWVSVWEICR